MRLFLLGIGLFLASCQLPGKHRSADQAPAETMAGGQAVAFAPLTIATWNVEHLALPEGRGCRPRSADEIAAMKHYVERMDADIVALQEVESAQAVAMVFPSPEWTVVLSARPDSSPYKCRESGAASTQQKVAFAVRDSVTIDAVAQYPEFALGVPGLRYGLGITVNTVDGPLEILNVHLKSGCFVTDYTNGEAEACRDFANQAPILDDWVERRESAGSSYLVLGDFNHRISVPHNRLTQLLTRTASGSPSSLNIITRQLVGCHPRYPEPIDHILVGGSRLQKAFAPAEVHVFEDMQESRMLSDHCAVSVTLFAQRQRLSSAVKWTTESREYQLITRAIYQAASDSLRTRQLPDTPWVVVMDLDETVLDNSAYQRWLDATGLSFASSSWQRYVMSERSTLVPGARDFIESVWAVGGKVAFITNRAKDLDQHTWANLRATGLQVEPANACLLGRTEDDRKAVGQIGMVNDKDRRRQQLKDGLAQCYRPDASIPLWSSPKQIIMQVGDNIEDIGGTTQENAELNDMLARWPSELIILPNPMYGSW